MKTPLPHLHPQLRARVHSVLTAALRADPAAIDTAVKDATDLDAPTADFLRDSRRLMLACAAALSTVLDIHRPTADPHTCHACGTRECRTLTAVLHVLDAYATHPATVDRAEAWRRADRYFNPDNGPALPISIEDIGEGFAARAHTTEPTEPVLVIDRRTGRLTRWPLMPRDTLIEEYRRHLAARR